MVFDIARFFLGFQSVISLPETILNTTFALHHSEEFSTRLNLQKHQ